MDQVIDACINGGILVKLLTERRGDIIMTSILNYDQTAHEQALYEDGYEEGALLGTLKAVQRMMKNMGVSLEKAMDTLEITGEDRETIAKAVKG